MNEEVAAQNYLLGYLTGDATLSGMLNGGVYCRAVPARALDPFVKIDRLDGSDLMAVGLIRVWDDLTFLVRTVVRWTGSGVPDWSVAGAIADRLDELLHDHEAADTVVRVHSFREESFTDETIESGDVFLHAGGIYRLRAQAV